MSEVLGLNLCCQVLLKDTGFSFESMERTVTVEMLFLF